MEFWDLYEKTGLPWAAPTGGENPLPPGNTTWR